MQALQVALPLRIVESLQILSTWKVQVQKYGFFFFRTILFLWDVLYKIKNYRLSFVPDPNKTIDLFCKHQHLWAKFMGKIVLWWHPYNTWPENFAPWSKYMANRPPRGRFIQGLYKPTQGKCAIYSYPGVSNQVFWHSKPLHPFTGGEKISKGTFQMLPNRTQHSAGWCKSRFSEDLRIFDRTLFLETIVTTVWSPVCFLEIYRQISHDFYWCWCYATWGFLLGSQGIPMVQRAVGVPKRGCDNGRHGVEFWRT